MLYSLVDFSAMFNEEYKFKRILSYDLHPEVLWYLLIYILFLINYDPRNGVKTYSVISLFFFVIFFN